METLKEGVTHPFNLFTFGFGFKRHYHTDSCWNIYLGFILLMHIRMSFQIKLDGAQSYFFGYCDI